MTNATCISQRRCRLTLARTSTVHMSQPTVLVTTTNSPVPTTTSAASATPTCYVTSFHAIPATCSADTTNLEQDGNCISLYSAGFVLLLLLRTILCTITTSACFVFNRPFFSRWIKICPVSRTRPKICLELLKYSGGFLSVTVCHWRLETHHW